MASNARAVARASCCELHASPKAVQMTDDEYDVIVMFVVWATLLCYWIWYMLT